MNPFPTGPIVAPYVEYNKGFITLSNGNLVRHHCGGLPRRVSVYLLNVVADLGYVPGDRVSIGSNVMQGSNLTGSFYVTKEFVGYPQVSGQPAIIHASTRVNTAVTANRWHLIYKVYR